jgi:hypothetical protein
MSLVHGSRDPGPPWTSLHCRLMELGLWPFRGSRLTTKGRGVGSGACRTRSGSSEAVGRWRKVVAGEGLRWERAKM